MNLITLGEKLTALKYSVGAVYFFKYGESGITVMIGIIGLTFTNLQNSLPTHWLQDVN